MSCLHLIAVTECILTTTKIHLKITLCYVIFKYFLMNSEVFGVLRLLCRLIQPVYHEIWTKNVTLNRDQQLLMNRTLVLTTVIPKLNGNSCLCFHIPLFFTLWFNDFYIILVQSLFRLFQIKYNWFIWLIHLQLIQ